MTTYLLFVGGSGIRVAKSFIHLCAAGCFKREKFKAMLIDTDRSNGDTKILKDTIDAYNKIAINVHEFPEINFYTENGEIEVWNPLSGNPDDAMSQRIGYNLWNSANMKDLYDFLYTENEKNIKLSKGFYGYTSIGSYFMADAIKGTASGELNPNWHSFFSGMGSNDAIFVIGSMFGGTGASAIPTIAKILKRANDTQGHKCGCVILMPYYRTVSSEKKAGAINSKLFAAKNKAALNYYADEKICDDFDRIYFVGEDKNYYMDVKNCNGGEMQRNKANYVEVEAALTIGDYIRDINAVINGEMTDNEFNSEKTYDVDYTGEGNPVVNLLNTINPNENYCTDMITFLETAIIYNKAIYFIAKGEAWRGASWVGNYNVNQEHSDDFRKYCKMYVDWMFELLTDTRDGEYYENAETPLSEGKEPRKSSFDIVNIEGEEKLRLFTDFKYVKPKGFFKDEFASFETMSSLSNDDNVKNLTGKEILMTFGNKIGGDVKTMSQVINCLRNILAGGDN